MTTGSRALPFVALLLLPLSALADFKKDYDSALKAIENSNWQQAAADLERAIAENPDAMERVRMYGMKFIPYLPHYHLGLARFRMGDCAGAIAAWDIAEAKGVIQSQNEFAQLQRDRQICAAQVVDVSTIAATARNVLDALAESLRELERLSKAQLLESEWSSQDEWRSALSEGQTAVAQLGDRLSAAESAKDADAIEAISSQASALRNRVQQVTGAANQRLSALKTREEQRLAQARENARRDLTANVDAARSAIEEQAPDERSRTLQANLQRLLAQADQLGANASTDALVQTNRDLNTTVREFRQAVQNFEAEQRALAARVPPPGLKQVAEAYFSGDYDTAIGLADPQKFSDERERIQAHLFRAASRYNLYMLANQAPTDLLEQARDDIRRIKALDRRFSPYVAAFPPKFTKLFEQTSG